jgi:hypothetical protein
MSALSLLVLRVSLADDARDAVPLHDFAVLADRLNARSDLHRSLQFVRTRNWGKTMKIGGLEADCK